MPSVSNLSELRDAVRSYLSEKRYAHTLAVEKEIVRLGELYLPEKICALRIAALLHDITKERTGDEQLALCEQYGLPLHDKDRLSTKTLHAKTGAAVAEAHFPNLVTHEILSAIARHTTGAKEMSVFDKLLYLADYIEETRTFPDCIRLRKMFWEGIVNLPRNKYEEHLNRVLLESYNITIADLRRKGAFIASDTMEARDALVAYFNKYI